MSQQISVLLVDDNQLVSDSLRAWLEDDGFNVHTALCAEEAKLLLATSPIEVALIDLKLSDMSGEKLIIQVINQYPKSRFLIHTGAHSYRLSLALQNLGMQDDDIIYKPVMSLILLSEIIRRKVEGAEHDS